MEGEKELAYRENCIRFVENKVRLVRGHKIYCSKQTLINLLSARVFNKCLEYAMNGAVCFSGWTYNIDNHVDLNVFKFTNKDSSVKFSLEEMTSKWTK